MATAAAIREYRRTQNDIVRLAERELRQFFASLDPDNPMAAVRALEEFMPALIQEFGEIGATVAADFYEELRTDSPGVRRAYTAVLGDAIPIEQSRVSTKWAVGPLFQQEADPDAAFNNLFDITDRLIKQQSRSTIHHNAQRDPDKARYARVPTGAETCEFCLMLASRGAVYLDKTSAGEMNKYHGRCDCVPTPVWDDSDYDQLKANGYDPEAYYERYLKASKA